MKKIVFASIFVFAACFIAYGQDLYCPKIEISVPQGMFVEGYDFTFTANVGNHDPKKLDYKWTISHGEIKNGQGTPVIQVPGSRELNGQIVKITVEIKGLPPNCTNRVSENFEILYNPGTPLRLDVYEKISFKEEKFRLRFIAAELKNKKDSAALFVFHFTERDNLQALKTRLLKISKHLTETQKIPKHRFNFVIAKMGDVYRTVIYLQPKDLGFEKINWEENLEQLKIKKQRQNKPIRKTTKRN